MLVDSNRCPGMRMHFVPDEIGIFRGENGRFRGFLK